ncbi:MAG: RNA helicase, partial [Micrococcales bacterium]|nr:RNA helicase [Micrococcales bacterium]
AVEACLRGQLQLNSKDESVAVRQLFEQAAAALPTSDLTVVGYHDMVRAAERGFGAHHAGQLPVFKQTLELAFQEGLIKLVFATETLALGINMPARTVVMDRLDKWDGQNHEMLTAGEYTQLTGRAGRRGIDVEGHAVVVSHRGFDPHQLANLASKRSYRLDSAFQPTYNMAVNLVHSMGLDRAMQVLEMSFAQFQADRSVVDLAKEVRQMDKAVAGYREAAKGESGQRWAKRLGRLQSRRDGLMKAINARTTTVARRFGQVSDVLIELGYLKKPANSSQLAVTKAGRVLSKIYAERDLVIAEAMRTGAWDGLSPAELAAVVAALVYEPRGQASQTPPSSKRLRQALGRTEQAWRKVEAAERAHGLPPSLGLEIGASAAVYLWALGEPLAQVLPQAELPPGDFVRLVKQVIDVLNHVASASADSPLHAASAASAQCLERGVVAWEADSTSSAT